MDFSMIGLWNGSKIDMVEFLKFEGLGFLIDSRIHVITGEKEME